MRVIRFDEGLERDKGTPKSTAINAAREKLRTDVTDITVDAKHKFKAFSKKEVEALSLVAALVSKNDMKVVIMELIPAAMEKTTVWFCRYALDETKRNKHNPAICVATMMDIALIAGRALRSHWIVEPGFSVAICLQPALTQTPRPPNIMDVLMITTLGR